jgi:predicted ATPase
VLIGRTNERRRLREALELCRASGHGRVVLVVGEAGIGKSRLIADLEEDARASGFAWTWTENLSYATGDPFGFARTFAERLSEEHGIDAGAFARRLLFGEDVAPESARRYSGGVAAIAREAAFSGWEDEATLVPGDPGELQAALLEVAARFSDQLAAVFGPRVIVIDDFHWADRSSVPLVAELIRQTAVLPFLVVVAMRPEPRPAWTDLDHVEVVDLHGLGPAETGRLAASVVGAELSSGDASRLHERTDGNPLFIGETVRALLEDGGLTVRDGRLALASGEAIEEIPLSLRALLGARIDALSDEARTVLQVGSVIGMRFSGRLVGDLIGVPLEPVLFQGLTEAALISPAGETDAWRFEHPLIHDAAYAGLLASRRRILHTRLADHLEANEPTVQLGQLAQHRAAAGDVQRAVPLLDKAAEEAVALGATAEAANYWRAAARLLGESHPDADTYRGRAAELMAPAMEAGLGS